MASQKFNLDKNAWRLRLKQIRQELSEERKLHASRHACLELHQKCQQASLVLSFASFGSEINLWPLNQKLAQEGRLVLPLMQADHSLELYLITDFNQLESHPLGMLEPKTAGNKLVKLISPSSIEIALIPGLGFDLKTRVRLGYGKGYYDRLLAGDSLKETWGIGFYEQEVENLPVCEHDIPLGQIILF